MRAGMWAIAVEQLKKSQSAIRWRNMGRNKGWNPQYPGLLMRWPGVVMHLSHDGHVTDYATHPLPCGALLF